MNRREIKERVAEIRSLTWDNEAAHSREDKLQRDFIEHVAKTSVRPYSDWAKLILEVSKFHSSKWCA